MSKLSTYFNSLPKRLLNDQERSSIIKSYTYIALGGVSFFMTIVNIFTKENELGISTAIFAFLCFVNLFLQTLNKKLTKISDVLFGVSVILFFSFFIIFGYPKGFSIIWIALMPPIALLFYGVKRGSIIFACMYIILIFFMWTNVGHSMLRNEANYSDTFMLRFPFLCAGSFILALILAVIKDMAFKELSRINEINASLSTHDTLTSLLNREGMREAQQIYNNSNAYSLIYGILDIDHFKEINDSNGHLFGDYILKEFAKLFKDNLPGTKCRYGGDEFAFICKSDEFSKKDIENFIKVVKSHEFTCFEKTIHITISCGLFKANKKEYSNSDFCLKNADIALYKTKENGKNGYSMY